MTANVQYLYEFMDHEGIGYYHSETPNMCDENTGLGKTDESKNCVFAHTYPSSSNWVTYDNQRQGQVGNMAFNVEAYEEPFETTFGATTDRLTISADLNMSCQNFINNGATYHNNKFPGFKLHVDMHKDQFATYKETFELTDFPYKGNVSHPAHSIGFVYFFSSSSARVSVGGSAGVYRVRRTIIETSRGSRVAYIA